MARKKVSVSVWIDSYQRLCLEEIKARDGVPLSELYRQAMDVVIQTHRDSMDDTVAEASMLATTALADPKRRPDLLTLAKAVRRLVAKNARLSGQLARSERMQAHARQQLRTLHDNIDEAIKNPVPKES